MALLNLPQADLILYSPFSKDYLQISVKFDNNFSLKLIDTITQKYFQNLLHFYCLNK